MTVDECIQAYRDFVRQAFTQESMRKPTSSASVGPAFSGRRLEDAIKSTIRRFCIEGECKVRRNNGDRSTAHTCPHVDLLFRDDTCTKTYVTGSG